MPGQERKGNPRPRAAGQVLGRRYELQSRLGAGAWGVVYQAVDRTENRLVAVKTLSELGPEALYFLKNEFRTLADIAHPNVARLHELVSDGGDWFIVMELVDGASELAASLATPFWRLGERTDTLSAPEVPQTGTYRREDRGPSSARVPRTPVDPVAPVDGEGPREPRIRSAFTQLAHGLLAIHEKGVLHRDIKPSNVLVDRRGRVVIVDFGIAVGEGHHHDPANVGYMIGTAGYMAPEQARAWGTVTAAADWYSVGVVLYQVLTGRLPFPSDPFRLSSANAPPRPEGVDADLAQLCVELLDVRPERRPTGAEVLRRLRGAARPESLDPNERRDALAFVGRERALHTLQEAFDRVVDGQTALVCVRGESGIGKTTLVKAFLDPIGTRMTSGENGRGPPLVLAGRCYARESVPFKTFDGVIDALTRFLRQRGEGEPLLNLALDAGPLVRMFPVLGRVPAFADASEGAGPSDPAELRQRAFAALRALFSAVAEERPLVVFVDDAQWGDVDSDGLLAELTRGGDAPALLMILAYRSQDSVRTPALAAYTETIAKARAAKYTIDLEELSERESEELANLLLESTQTSGPQVASQIAREARGSPFFVHQLAQQARSRIEPGESRLDRVVADRLSRLPAAACALLEAVSVAGGPVPIEVALQVARVPPEERSNVVRDLTTARLVRTSGPREQEMVEPYHDRIGRAAVERLDAAALSNLHGSLLGTLEAAGDGADPEILFFHAQNAGDVPKAIAYAEASARAAAAQLAFQRAARYYAGAIALLSPGSDHWRDLQLLLAKALVDAGRGKDAADAYLQAAPLFPMSERTEIERRAAEQLLCAGHLSEGIQVAGGALQRAGLTVPSSESGKLLRIVALRAWLRVRGTRARLRPETEISPAELFRLDTCSSVGQAISVADPLLGQLFQAYTALLALRAGEAKRLARALAVEASTLSVTRGGHARALAMFTQAKALAGQDLPADMAALFAGVAGMIGHFNARWEQSLEAFGRAHHLHRTNYASSARWERDTVEHYELTTAIYRGRVRQAIEWHGPRLRSAVDRGDLYLSTILQVSEANLVWLFRDDPRGARDAIDGAAERWPESGFRTPEWWSMLARTYVDLYDEAGETAMKTFEATWPMALRSRIPQIVEFARVTGTYRRGAVALAAATQASSAAARLERALVAERAARSLLREPDAYPAAFALVLRAGAAKVRGNASAARTAYERAAVAFEAHDTDLWAAAARYRLGELLGGDEGRSLVQSAERWMADQGIARPDRIVGIIAPG